MKKIIIILICSCISISLYSQHIEIISEVTDSMILINKTDVDIINNVFYQRNVLDTLNQINENIINNLVKIQLQNKEIIFRQKVIIQNDSIIKNKYKILLQEKDKIIQNNQKTIKSQKTQKIIWQSTSGILGIVLLIVLLI